MRPFSFGLKPVKPKKPDTNSALASEVCDCDAMEGMMGVRLERCVMEGVMKVRLEECKVCEVDVRSEGWGFSSCPSSWGVG